MRKKFILEESELPKRWYNIKADLAKSPDPLLNPSTKEPLKPVEMEGLFAKELVNQEFSNERWIDIPEEVLEMYKIYRPTPLVRAYGLERALDTPARIYFKNESVSPVGSHKLNTAIPQAYYNKVEGIKRLTTETGAGQWGSAMSIACRHFGLELDVFMVRQSYDAKPYRRVLMNSYGASVHASPSEKTEFGRSLLNSKPEERGSLGIAISEAVEAAVSHDSARYTLGSVLDHVLIHQSIIGLEAEMQMEMAGVMPDKVIACFGGGSNFAGIAFPFIRHNIKAIAAEPAACPKLTRGEFRYDYGDTAGLTPLIPMFTLGHDFSPEQIHAAGLRYHGGGRLPSHMKREGLIDSAAVDQDEAFAAGLIFARSEGILPAPESTHAIAVVLREALKAKEAGKSEVLLFNLSGHGLLDLAAYEDFLPKI
ncbi:MAG: TrpB-like pyridoxal-phosphate dependent enzyme [Bacteroidetes bacterium 41-46]|nr:MAG: TrpB-like pyridoxal-phosphate dependent enzyme [Bacteroidetes bacterium 41-46]